MKKLTKKFAKKLSKKFRKNVNAKTSLFKKKANGAKKGLLNKKKKANKAVDKKIASFLQKGPAKQVKKALPLVLAALAAVVLGNFKKAKKSKKRRRR